MAIDDRASRLQQRFSAIRTAVAMTYGEDKAFCACSAAWLMTIEHTIYESLKNIQRGGDPATMKDEAEAYLRSFHQELCEHLGVDYKEALMIAHQFDEVIIDICSQKG